MSKLPALKGGQHEATVFLMLNSLFWLNHYHNSKLHGLAQNSDTKARTARQASQRSNANP